MASNNAKITPSQRNEILQEFICGDREKAQGRAIELHLAPDYAYKLARSRGLVPRTAKRWAHLREVI